MAGRIMSNLQWHLNHTGSSWYLLDDGHYSWGSVAIISNGSYGVFVRYARFEPAKWVAEVNDLGEAKGLVQTLVGANHV